MNSELRTHELRALEEHPTVPCPGDRVVISLMDRAEAERLLRDMRFPGAHRNDRHSLAVIRRAGLGVELDNILHA